MKYRARAYILNLLLRAFGWKIAMATGLRLGWLDLDKMENISEPQDVHLSE